MNEHGVSMMSVEHKNKITTFQIIQNQKKLLVINGAKYKEFEDEKDALEFIYKNS